MVQPWSVQPYRMFWKCAEHSPTRQRGRQAVELDRIVAMLTKLGNRGYAVREKTATYGTEFDSADTDSESDTDTDSDSDTDTEGDIETHTDSH